MRNRITDKDCKTIGAARHAPIKTICPWDKIPKEVIKDTGKQPIKTRTKSFEDLENLALAGISYHWGRNRKHAVAKNVNIHGEQYEVYVEAINTEENAMEEISLSIITNGKSRRSRNWELSRKIFFNYGYLNNANWYNPTNNWSYRNLDFAIMVYKETSAHEIGHEILLYYGGHLYSKKHKGTTTLLQSENAGLKYPEGEIDLMLYFDEIYAPEFSRVAVSEKDVLSLVWLTQLK